MMEVQSSPDVDWLLNGGHAGPSNATAKFSVPANDDVNWLLDGGKASAQPTNQPAAQPASTGLSVSDDTKGLGEAALSFASGLGSSIVGGYHGLYQLASGLKSGKSLGDAASAAANVIQGDQQAMTYQPTTDSGKAALGLLNHPANPINYIPEATEALGDVAAAGAGKVGLSPTGQAAAGTAVTTGLNALMSLVPLGRKGEAAPLEKPAIEAPAATALTAQTPETLPAVIPKAGETVPVSQGAAAPLSDLPVPKVTEFVKEPVELPQGQSLPTATQAERAAILQRIGLDKARQSSLEGNAMNGAVESQMTKFQEPAGVAAKEQFDAERTALTNHAENLVNQTGGTIGMDEASRYSRGNTILAPLDNLKQWFDTQTSRLYKEADAKAQGTPTTLNQFKDILGDDSLATNSDRINLRTAAMSYLKKLGMIDENGNISGSVQQAETMRKYLNENWSPQNSGLVGKLKDALDNDVTFAAGDDIYQQARAVRALRGATLDDPKGIAKIMDSSGPSGINRAVEVPKIPDAVTSMAPDQLSHIVDTLQNKMPPELRGEADAALAEIKAHFANQVFDAGSKRVGQWGARDVSRVLNNNAEKMSRVFTPEEMQRFKDLNDAGHILSVNASYPGAAAQFANAVNNGFMTRAGGRVGTGIGATIGAVFGFPGIGAVAGEETGTRLGARAGERRALTKFQKGTVKLNEVGK